LPESPKTTTMPRRPLVQGDRALLSTVNVTAGAAIPARNSFVPVGRFGTEPERLGWSGLV
jgi:hypothetical protein